MLGNCKFQVGLAGLLGLALLSGCAAHKSDRTTTRDKTAKGAMIGGAAGAVAGALSGEGELDEVLAGAAVGAAAGAGVGAYMDAQEEKLARIPGTTVERLEDGVLLLRFESDVLFPINSATLNETAKSSLADAANVLAEYRKTTVVAQGHTDSSGAEQYNQVLSERRANAVVGFLIGRGVEPARITGVGYGESEPIANNDTPEGKAVNRRVDLLLRAKAR